MPRKRVNVPDTQVTQDLAIVTVLNYNADNKGKSTKMATVDNISIDFSAVKSFEPVPTDTYDAVFVGGKVRDNQKKDGQVFNAEFTIENGDDQYNGRKLFRGFSLKPQALWALKDFLLACGIDEDEFTEDANLGQLINDAEGSHVVLDVEMKPNEKKEGKFFNEIKDIRANN